MSMPQWASPKFGSIVVNGTRYDHDLIVTVAGDILPRPKQLSKKYGGWHTVLGPEEVEHALVGEPDILLVATGHFGVLPIRAETRARLAQRGVALELARHHDTLERYTQLVRENKRVAMILHLTC